MQTTVTVIAALGSGLVAGFFFAFSAVVMASLKRLPAAHGIAVMNTINVVVLNPWFFGAFFGTALVCLALAALTLLTWSPPASLYVVAGAAIYLVGTTWVTMAFNVPLNNALAKIDADSDEGAALWRRYLSVWTAWNHVRTVAPFASCALFIMALLR
ncbi:MAG: anthrone oxygenase family protein [Caulobacteraceae bacterium]